MVEAAHDFDLFKQVVNAKQRLSSRNAENDEKVVAKLMSYVLSHSIDAMLHCRWENFPSGIKIIFIDLAAPAVLGAI